MAVYLPKVSRTPDPLGANIPPVVQDIDFFCPDCKKRVRARMTAYPDAIYVSDQNGHRHTFTLSQELPTWRDWLNVNSRDESDPQHVVTQEARQSGKFNRDQAYRWRDRRGHEM